MRNIAIAILAVLAIILAARISPTMERRERESVPQPSGKTPSAMLPFAKEKNTSPPQEEPSPSPPRESPTARDLAAAKRRILQSFTETESGGVVFTDKSEGFLIEYYPRADMFFAFLDEPFEQRREAVQQWFRAFGLAQSDLCDLNIRLYPKEPSEQWYAAHPNFSALPDGCPASTSSMLRSIMTRAS